MHIIDAHIDAFEPNLVLLGLKWTLELKAETQIT